MNKWGGARFGAGRPKQYLYKKIPLHGHHIERSEPKLLTPESDLTICLAEMDEGGRRGVMIGDIWYGSEEVQAIAAFTKEHKQWLQDET